MTASPQADNPEAPLRGLRVLELGQYIAAPAAAQTLAELGADVIKIEPPGGDVARRLGWTQDDYGPMFSAYNRGKRSVVLDLRSDEGRAQARQLALCADVLLQNARPGAMERLGLGAEQLMPHAPRLVYGRVSAFGRTGPASQRVGFDIAAQAESAMMSLNGEGGRPPVRVGFTVVDLLASQQLASGVLAALVRRGITGRGALVDLSLIDVAVAALANAWTEYRLLGTMPLRRGNGQPHVAPAAEVIETRDGMIVLSAYTEEHFAKLCQAIGQPELATDPRFATSRDRVRNRPEMLAVLHEALSHFESDPLCEMLAQAGIVAGNIRTMEQVRPGQAGVSADLFIDVAAAGRGPISVPGLPISLDGLPRRAARLPALGEHTAEVLAELAQAGAAAAG